MSSDSEILATLEAIEREVSRLRAQIAHRTAFGPDPVRGTPAEAEWPPVEAAASPEAHADPAPWPPGPQERPAWPPAHEDEAPEPATAWPTPAQTSPATPAASAPAPARRRGGVEEWIGRNLLAVLGGGAVLIGIVFFVAFAIREGLISEGMRMLLAAAACAGVLAVADLLHRRYPDGTTIPRVLGVVGLLGGCATLMGSIDLYHLIPVGAAYPIAAGIVAVGVLMAHRIAMLWMADVAIGGTVLAVMSVARMHAWGPAAFAIGALVVAIALALRSGRWHTWATGVVAAMFATWPGDSSGALASDWLPIACVALLGFAGAFAIDLRRKGPTSRAFVVLLPALAAWAGLIGWNAAETRGFEARGDWWVMAFGVLWLAVGLGYHLTRLRPLGRIVATIGFAQIGVALGLILEGPALVLSWSAQAAVAAWVARRLLDRRVLLGSAVALAAATVAALVDAPVPRALIHDVPPVGRGVIALIALAIGYAAVDRFAGPFLADKRGWLSAAAAVVGLFAVSVAIAQALGAEDQSTQVILSAFWAVVGLGAIVLGLTRRVAAIRIGGLALFGAALGKLVLYDLAELDSLSRAGSFVAVGALALAGAFAYQRLRDRLAGVPPSDPGADTGDGGTPGR